MRNKSAMDEYLAYAIEVAQQCGDTIIIKHYGHAKEISFKGEIDLVTNADKESEKFVVNKILQRFPEHQVLCEEGSKVNEHCKTHKWIVDPLDGTTNFSHDYPLFGISIGLEYKGEIIVGVVYDPLHKELFYAAKGQGTFLNGKPVRVSKITSLNKSLVATGFGYDIRYNPGKSIDYFAEMLLKTQAMRRDGSAALDLCFLACGRFDAFYELRLQPWDVAAGSLIVLEAGGRITNYHGETCSIYDREILASNSYIHDEILEVFKCVGY
jgi:myo-inositol-1(or 4)-monophosphatase